MTPPPPLTSYLDANHMFLFKWMCQKILGWISHIIQNLFHNMYIILSQQNWRKKIGSNDENLRKFEPQQKQRVIIKKKCIGLKWSTCCETDSVWYGKFIWVFFDTFTNKAENSVKIINFSNKKTKQNMFRMPLNM